ncbi:hypothetical protein E4U17_002846 [Claviceps sp. LM77 group G4]|nr:hypothetical protein E4U17_002846 [Claviceps sp. LM77 group G4]KAG6068098.1 hypothetical protein E4U33_005121 [Claviceps sp. LM78 group G4]KAG6072584.1 hypothetical protein E4U16_005252 [Claviceps sp. LM84 group G4]
MEIQTACEVYNISGDRPVFHHTEIVIRGNDNQFFLATTELDKTAAYTIDLEKLDKFAVDNDTVWPPYSARLLRAPTPVPQDSYIKEPSLLDYDRTPNAEPLSNLVLHEIEAYELLREHPHPNIVDYRGCVVMDGRIKGLCLAKYKMTLRNRMDESTALDKDLCIEGIERGVRHLHSLGIVHNDINPTNIMLDELDNPIIIDFDSWQREGQKLGFKGGSLDWSIEGTEYARFENDFYGLSKLREFIYNPWP